MSTSLKVAAAIGAPDVADAVAEADEEADAVAEADEEAAEDDISWRAWRLAGTAATRGARAKRPLRIVDTLGMLVN